MIAMRATSVLPYMSAHQSSIKSIQRTAPVGAACQRVSIRRAERHTTNKHILIGVHRNGMYDTLHPVKRDIVLRDQLVFYDERERHTGKQPLAIGDKSEILTGFSVALGGIGLPWGITTSSYV